MTASDFVRALAEQGVLVTEATMAGKTRYTLETYRAGTLRRYIFVDDSPSMPLSARRAICEDLGLDESMIPVSVLDLIEPE